MRSAENYVARELLDEFPTWADMRVALEIARRAVDAVGIYHSLYSPLRLFAAEAFV